MIYEFADEALFVKNEVAYGLIACEGRSASVHGTNQEKPRGRTLAIIGAWMQAALLLGLMGTVIGMKGAFAELGKKGASDVGALSGHIGEVLIWMIAGQSVAAVGAVLLGIGVIGLHYRRTWAMVILSLASLNLAGVLLSVLKTALSRAL